jgi:hypothetical protein
MKFLSRLKGFLFIKNKTGINGIKAIPGQCIVHVVVLHVDNGLAAQRNTVGRRAL